MVLGAVLARVVKPRPEVRTVEGRPCADIATAAAARCICDEDILVKFAIS